MRYINKDDEDMILVEKAAKKKTSKHPNGNYGCKKCKDFLRDTYNHLCCYCQSAAEVSGGFEIEHFYPKEKNPEYLVDIRNLHYSCKKCNVKKSDCEDRIISPNYYKKHPKDTHEDWILSTEEFIRSRLWYIGHFAVSHYNEDEGRNTIELLNLNNENGTKTREDLLNARLECYVDAFAHLENVFEDVKKILSIQPIQKISEQEMNTFRAHVNNLRGKMDSSSPYNVMIEDNFQDTLYKLMRIAKKKLVDIGYLQDVE